MNLVHIAEPELEFGYGRHIDIRFGLLNYGPLDKISSEQTGLGRTIGIVGTSESSELFHDWLTKCRKGIPAKDSKQPNLFPPFPGFGENQMLPSIGETFVYASITMKEVAEVCAYQDKTKIITEAVNLFVNYFEHLNDKHNVDVFVCAVPLVLLQKMESEPMEEDSGAAGNPTKIDFHDLLKSRTMRLGRPLQIVLPMTYDNTIRVAKKTRPGTRSLQDEATRAWNLYTAFYYKSGGSPWRIPRESTRLTTCYIGIGFFESLDHSSLLTSSAQIFNERGEGIILRGGKATYSKDDRQPHMNDEVAFQLMFDALETYRKEHRTMPARVVIQKTSQYTSAEMAGLTSALDDYRIEVRDFLTIRNSKTRLFRDGQYPPKRGAFLSLDHSRHVLYTRGSVEFFETYPGMYVPRPLEIYCEKTDQSPTTLAREILALTKLNWNNTQFDNDDPITVKAARNVGRILRYLSSTDVVRPRYSFYI